MDRARACHKTLFGMVVVVLLALGLAPVRLPGLGEPTAAAQELVIQNPGASLDHKLELNVHFAAYYGYGYVGFDNLGGLGGGAVGPGFDMLFRVVKNGFIPKLNNSFWVGFLVDPLFHLGFVGGSFMSLAVGPMVQWRFTLLKMFTDGELSVFANLGGGVWVWFLNAFGNCPGCGVGVTGFPLFQVGGNLFFTKKIAVRLAVGYPSVTIGATFAF